MVLYKIIKNYEDYILPHFCFEKKFDQYFYIENSILSGYDEMFFFEFLKNLENRVIDTSDSKQRWTLFCPKSDRVLSEYILINKPLAEIQQLFIKHRMNNHLPFSSSSPHFWMAFENKIQVYAVHDSELIIVGVDNRIDTIELKDVVVDESIREYFLENLSTYLNGYPEHITGVSEKNKAYVISHFSK